MNIAARTGSAWRAFFVGLTVGALCVYFALLATADTGIIKPDGNGNTNNGARLGGCESLANWQCVDDDEATTTGSISGDYISQSNGNIDTFTMTSISSANEVSEVRVWVYHQEGANMTLDVSLWDVNETTQYGTTVTLPARSTAQWDPAYFNTTNFPLDQGTLGELDGLRVRLQCNKGGGKGNQCDTYVVLADVVYTVVVNADVSTTSNQQNLTIGTTTAHVGGAFTIAEADSCPSCTVDSITITENGTVDAQNDLDNIELWYDIDNTNPYNCESVSYDGNETQFGSTDTNGFSGANGTSVFSGSSVSISSTETMCVYPVLDVLSTATLGETLELEISNPSTDVTVAGGSNVSPNTPIRLGGTTILTIHDHTQTHYHWRDDNGDETTSGSLTSGTDDTILGNAGIGTTYRLRMQVTNEGNETAPSTAFGLEYAVNPSQCSNVTDDANWYAVAATGGDWDMAGTGSGLTEGADTQNISEAIGGVADPGGRTFVGTGGERESTGTTSAVVLSPTQYYEAEFAIVAQSGASPGTAYCFRLADNGTGLDSYDVYAEATIAADVTVVATSSAQAQATAGVAVSNIYGGGFAITDDTAGSHQVQSITITASGTVDLQDHIENITLRYESDTTAPLDCTGETYSGTETIFGTVNGGGFSAAGTSTFTEISSPPTVENGVNALCFYVEFDSTASTTDGEGIEIRIADASLDVVTDSGSVSPAALVDVDGFTKFVRPIVTQEHYHWRDNLGTESGAGSLTGSEDLSYDELPINTVTRLRFGVSNTGGTTTSAYQYQLEWAQRLTTCSEATGWVNVDTGSDEWQMAASQLVDNADTTNVSPSNGGITDVGAFLSPNGGQQDSDDITSNITLDSGEYLELEYSLEATSLATEGSSYCFRVTNAGTPLDAYDNYARATIKLGTDYKIQRGKAIITAGQTSTTTTAGVHYEAPVSATSSFIRIINNGYTGRGPTGGVSGNANAADVTAYISNPGNITSSITFTRQGVTGETYIEWEIIEYIGDQGGENEMIVRGTGVATYVSTQNTVTTGVIPNVVDNSAVVPFITGQNNANGGRFYYHVGLSTAAWNAGATTTTFTRGDNGSSVSNVSYAIVEFTGDNWKVQRAQMDYDANYTAGTATTSPITSVNHLSRAFVHAQHSAGSNQDEHADFGNEVWLSSVGFVSFRLNGSAQDPTQHSSVAWIIENTQTVGDVLEVQRDNRTITAGSGGLTSVNYTMTNQVDDLSVTSINYMNTSNGAVRTFPEPITSANLISDTQYNVQITDHSEEFLTRVEVIEWPTAARKLRQASFWIYEDNDTLDPDTAWNGGLLGENAEMTENDGPMALGDSARIRMNVEVTAAAMPAGTDAFNLEYAVNPGSCSAVTNWNLVGDTGSSTAPWRGHAGSPADGATLPTTKLSASTVVGTYEESMPSALTPSLALVGDYVEFDWNVEHNGALDKTSYCFRMVNGDRSEFVAGYSTTYPVLRTVGYGPEIGGWQWFDDATSTEPSTPLNGAAENVAPSGVDDANVIKLRLVLAEKQGADGVNTKFKLQYSEDPTFATVYDVVSTTSCAQTATTTSRIWCYADGAGDDNDIIQSAVISDADSCAAGVGPGCGTRNEGTTTPSTFTHTAFTNAEYEFTIEQNAARVGAVYYFRLYDLVNDEVVAASSTYPSLTTQAATLEFIVTGLPAGTTTEGITADVTTVPGSVPFGSVPLDTEYEAAYRLRVDTNATEGYQLLMFTRQNLMNTYGTAIPSITHTNASPGSWSSGCTGLTACFGYHTSDDVLGNGSTRFAPDDSYAAASTTPEEIMYSSVPTEDTVDLVYKLQVGQLQPAGDYQTEIVYIAVPTY